MPQSPSPPVNTPMPLTPAQDYTHDPSSPTLSPLGPPLTHLPAQPPPAFPTLSSPPFSGGHIPCLEEKDKAPLPMSTSPQTPIMSPPAPPPLPSCKAEDFPDIRAQFKHYADPVTNTIPSWRIAEFFIPIISEFVHSWPEIYDKAMAKVYKITRSSSPLTLDCALDVMRLIPSTPDCSGVEVITPSIITTTTSPPSLPSSSLDSPLVYAPSAKTAFSRFLSSEAITTSNPTQLPDPVARRGSCPSPSGNRTPPPDSPPFKPAFRTTLAPEPILTRASSATCLSPDSLAPAPLSTKASSMGTSSAPQLPQITVSSPKSSIKSFNPPSQPRGSLRRRASLGPKSNHKVKGSLERIQEIEDQDDTNIFGKRSRRSLHTTYPASPEEDGIHRLKRELEVTATTKRVLRETLQTRMAYEDPESYHHDPWSHDPFGLDMKRDEGYESMEPFQKINKPLSPPSPPLKEEKKEKKKEGEKKEKKVEEESRAIEVFRPDWGLGAILQGLFCAIHSDIDAIYGLQPEEINQKVLGELSDELDKPQEERFRGQRDYQERLKACRELLERDSKGPFIIPRLILPVPRLYQKMPMEIDEDPWGSPLDDGAPFHSGGEMGVEEEENDLEEDLEDLFPFTQEDQTPTPIPSLFSSTKSSFDQRAWNALKLLIGAYFIWFLISCIFLPTLSPLIIPVGPNRYMVQLDDFTLAAIARRCLQWYVWGSEDVVQPA
ncbi:MAG: hypothetical protein DHS80DRAFT_26249 [Piptocephalis tieghemiana]|nr:MAG: hypothetical protein DHS80DRAFT_26249 [Piptocephalis tieghemiana]